jgi:hypothetical protein
MRIENFLSFFTRRVKIVGAQSGGELWSEKNDF